ncbi:MAG: hypothetical protein CM15mP84_03590 [Cellvibrionales bacterium]|nr:MAG: hypothetical protein CM15mP84_03590 [Cellvibrionales bacterium]
MVYLLILLGLAVVVAPLMSAMPSKAQRAKAGLRDLARTHDLRVSLRPLPAVPARFRFEPEDELACYERRFPSPAEVWGRHITSVLMDSGADNRGRGCPRWLQFLPLGAAYVECRNESVSIFWDEKRAPRGWLKSAKPLI